MHIEQTAEDLNQHAKPQILVIFIKLQVIRSYLLFLLSSPCFSTRDGQYLQIQIPKQRSSLASHPRDEQSTGRLLSFWRAPIIRILSPKSDLGFPIYREQRNIPENGLSGLGRSQSRRDHQGVAPRLGLRFHNFVLFTFWSFQFSSCQNQLKPLLSGSPLSPEGNPRGPCYIQEHSY